ncbi:MAG TPA: hypothetical protein PK225_10600 [Azonexus sp.]|jgi:phage terminase Nu1 subunit (DNA packaging protein)|nr:hypothetical protein [Azonexus sp.]
MDSPAVPKGRGGAREGAGRKTGVAVSGDSYAKYNAARAKKEGHLAKLAELDEMEATGQLVRTDAVLKEWQGIIANIRARLLALPSRLAAQAHGARTIGELQRLLQDGIAEALTELSGGTNANE